MAMRRLQVRIRGFVETRRWFCTEPPPPPSPSSSTKDSKETEAATSNSFIKKFMLSYPAFSPKVAEVNEKKGGSWYMLKDILTEMKSKMPPNCQINKQTVDEATSVAIVMEGNTDNGRVDKPEKGFIPSAGILNMKKSQIMGAEDSKNLSLVKSSDSAELAKPKQMEHTVEMSDLEKSLDAEAKYAANLPLVDIYSNNELPECKLVDQSREMLDVGKSHAEVKGSEDLSFGKISENAEPPEPIEALTFPTAELGQQLSDLSQSSSHIVEDEANIRASISDMQASDLKLTKADLSEKEKTCSLSAEENFLATENATSEKDIYLFNLFEETEKHKEVNMPKTDALKHKNSDLKNNRHVISLAEAFKKSRKDSGDKLINVKKVERDGTFNMKDAKPKGLLCKLIEASNGTSLSSSPTVLSKIISKFNGELSGSNESVILPSFPREHPSGRQHDKENIGKGEVKLERNKHREANSFSLAGKDDRGQEEQSHNNEIGNWNFKQNKNKKEMDCSEENETDIAAFEYLKPESSDSILLPSPNSDATPNQQMSSSEHRLLVKFLCKTTSRSDLNLAFCDCGPISEIRLVKSRSENRFNYAYIYFKTAEGLKRASSVRDVAICGTDIVLEPSSSLKAYNKIINSECVTDLDFPMAFMKNPSKTVMVKGLPEDLSFCHLTRALSCWGCVSSIAMGSSPSDAYVEFKSEEAKERALAEATVSELGKKLTIHRVDAPKTTVVRISNVNPNSTFAKIRSICDSHGKVKRLINRAGCVFDVYFSSSEWTNMVKILNRLNGLEVDRHRWIAQPATVIPVKMLQALWSEPEGRKHVHEMIQTICKRIEVNSIDTASMLGLAPTYYGDS